MIFSGILSCYIADRSGKTFKMIYAGISIVIVSLLILQQVEFASLSALLAFRLLGIAPAGLIIALSDTAMAVERRALVMGFYFGIYFLVVTPASTIAG